MDIKNLSYLCPNNERDKSETGVDDQMKKTVLNYLVIAAFVISAVFMSCDNFHNEDVIILKLGSLQKILDGYVIRTIDFDLYQKGIKIIKPN